MNEFFFVFIALGIVIPLSIFYNYNSKHSRIKRQLKQVPGKPIRHVQNGETVQICGTVEIIGDPLEAPLTGRNCAYYHILIEREIPHARRSRYVETFIEEEGVGNYLIRNGNHFAFVDQKGLLTKVIKDHSFSSGYPDDWNERLQQFLLKHENKTNDWHSFNCTLDYFEGILEQGEKVIVSGVCEWKSAASLGLPSEYGRILHVQAEPGSFSVISDDPKLMHRSEKASTGA